MKLTIVGCSGSYPGPNSPASAYLIETSDGDRTWRIMLDLGNGSLSPLQQLIPLDQLDAVVLSHLHPDHFMDLCGLYVYRRYRPDGPVPGLLPVYGPAGVADRFASAYAGQTGEDVNGTFDFRELSDGLSFTVGPLQLTAGSVLHTAPAFGVRVETGGQSLAYSGDTDACPGLVSLARGVDLLLCEASFQEGREDIRGVHLTGRRAGEVATQAGAQRLMLTHIPAWTDPDVVRAEAESAYAGPVELAAPLKVHDLQQPRAHTA